MCRYTTRTKPTVSGPTRTTRRMTFTSPAIRSAASSASASWRRCGDGITGIGAIIGWRSALGLEPGRRDVSHRGSTTPCIARACPMAMGRRARVLTGTPTSTQRIGVFAATPLQCPRELRRRCPFRSYGRLFLFQGSKRQSVRPRPFNVHRRLRLNPLAAVPKCICRSSAVPVAESPRPRAAAGCIDEHHACIRALTAAS